MYKALLDKVSRGRNLPPAWAAFFMAWETPGEMEDICSFSLPRSPLCRRWLLLWALAWACGALSIFWRGTAAIIPVPMRKSNKEADHKTQTRTAAPSLFRTAKWEIAKQEAAVNGQDEQATPTV